MAKLKWEMDRRPRVLLQHMQMEASLSKSSFSTIEAVYSSPKIVQDTLNPLNHTNKVRWTNFQPIRLNLVTDQPTTKW